MSAELLAQIYADPTDRAARSVYEDWLEERGDPRARAITLMLNKSMGKSLSREEQAELDAIVEQHWRAWVGPVVALIAPKSRTLFVDGFLADVKLQIESDADRRLAADPVLATLKWLTCERAEVVVRPTMKLLRTLSGSLRTFAALCELPYELDVESVFVDMKEWSRDLATRVLAARAPVFRNLRHLTTSGRRPHPIDWIVQSWIPTRVESISVAAPVPIKPFMDVYVANRQLKFILAKLPGSGGIHFTRWWPNRRALEVSLGSDTWDETLAAFDGIDGSGWCLRIKYQTESANLEEREARRAAIQQQFPSFAEVDIYEPFESPYEGGL